MPEEEIKIVEEEDRERSEKAEELLSNEKKK